MKTSRFLALCFVFRSWLFWEVLEQAKDSLFCPAPQVQQFGVFLRITSVLVKLTDCLLFLSGTFKTPKPVKGFAFSLMGFWLATWWSEKKTFLYHLYNFQLFEICSIQSLLHPEQSYTIPLSEKQFSSKHNLQQFNGWSVWRFKNCTSAFLMQISQIKKIQIICIQWNTADQKVDF